MELEIYQHTYLVAKGELNDETKQIVFTILSKDFNSPIAIIIFNNGNNLLNFHNVVQLSEDDEVTMIEFCRKQI